MMDYGIVEGSVKTLASANGRVCVVAAVCVSVAARWGFTRNDISTMAMYDLCALYGKFIQAYRAERLHLGQLQCLPITHLPLMILWVSGNGFAEQTVDGRRLVCRVLWMVSSICVVRTFIFVEAAQSKDIWQWNNETRACRFCSARCRLSIVSWIVTQAAGRTCARGARWQNISTTRTRRACAIACPNRLLFFALRRC